MKSKIAVGSIVALMAFAGVVGAQPAPSAELARLEAQLVNLRQKFNDRHPEVIAVNEKIRALRQADDIRQPRVPERRADGGDLEVARMNLENLRQRFTDKHPEVAAQAQRVKELEQQGAQ